MSAWYIFSSLGFYPFAPGSDQYQIGSPLVQHAVMRLENGKRFIIETKNQGEQNVYVEKIMLNGKVLNRYYLTHEEIMNGGTLIFYMTANKPNH
jgi:putative alpha-1,2-mannosidase